MSIKQIQTFVKRPAMGSQIGQDSRLTVRDGEFDLTTP
jgi:hypothetical protein